LNRRGELVGTAKLEKLEESMKVRREELQNDGGSHRGKKERRKVLVGCGGKGARS